MGSLLPFVPFIVFAVLCWLGGSTAGLIAGACSALIILGRDVVFLKHSPKLIEVGAVILFGALAVFALTTRANWTVPGVRLLVDSGLLALIVLSILMRRPFTRPYAQERTSPDIWHTHSFLRTNYMISGVWALAFAIIVLADAMLVYEPMVPVSLGIGTTVAALFVAFKFTAWYPNHNANKGK